MNARTIRELIDERASQSTDSVYLSAPARAEDNQGQSQPDITFGELRKRARAIAHYLHKQGIKAGDSVAFAMTNGPDCAVCLLGILYGGYRLTAINLASGRQTIGYVLIHSDTRLVFTQAEHRPLLEQAAALEESTAPPMVEVNQQWWDSLQGYGENTANVTPDADGLLMYTSGTTGRPKGVVLSHTSLVAAGKNPTVAHELTSTDRALCVLPLYHINGLCTTVLAPLYSGGSVLMPERFSTSQFWQWAREHRCTWFSVVPTHISYLLHEATGNPDCATGLEHIRFGRSASAPLSPDIQQAFESTFNLPIIETMGLTETAGQILSNPLPPGLRKIGSPGVAVGNEVMVADNNQREVARGVEGEILVRGDNVMNRYLKNETVTAETITSDGWLRTGDLGHQDEDGYLFVTGRSKELIIKGGENIAPREVDEALYQHSAVIEAAAFACTCPRYGQRVEAAVVIQADSEVQENDLMVLCIDTVGKFKAPDRIHFLDELPKGPSGKIQRLKLVELLA